jgi:NTP pyrophosphatase (non-canonical NTP hydrolase)
MSDTTVIERALQTRRERSARTAARIEDAAILRTRTFSSSQWAVIGLREDIGDKWPNPGIMDSYVFIVTEVGELGDALLRTGYGLRGTYVRNRVKEASIKNELGDVLLMLCTLATELGIDLDEALQGCINFLRSKHGATEPSGEAQVHKA